jgi:anhydro-N-acetylmuramic acid kinase
MNQLVPTTTLTAIGLMSGTSLDGVDAAVIITDGEGQVESGAAISIPYPQDLRNELRCLLDRLAIEDDLRELRSKTNDLEARLTRLNGRAVRDLMCKSGLEPSLIDVVGYHGQTLLHRPEVGVTIQIGSGEQLAEQLGIQVVTDFRQNDVKAGGEGAPLAPAYHRALAMASGCGVQCLVNIGGVANVTWLDTERDPQAFDTGPGNALLDDFIVERTGALFDEGGVLACAGNIDQSSLEELLDHPYFNRPPPKSLDRNAFSLNSVSHLSTNDGAATLAAFTARTIARAQEHFLQPPRRWVICGGGRKNLGIMNALTGQLGQPVISAEQAGWRGDDIEAQAFAYLAVRSLKGLPLSWPTTTGVPTPMTGGVVHTPNSQDLRTGR